MSEERNEILPGAEGMPRWLVLAVVVLAGLSLAALGIAWRATNHATSAEQSLTGQVKTLQQNNELLTQRLAQTESTSAQMQGELSVVTDRLKLTQGELGKARRQANQIRDQYSKQLTEMQSSLSTKASADDVNKLGTDVTGIRTDLDSTKQNIQMARGELGTLIARNHEEIDQLRRMGQRDYFEFTIQRKARQKVGDLMLELRGTNVKRNQFTMALYVDDMRLEKKNRSVNEPIYFYTRGSRQPLELVVNQVGKDRVVGYLSVPKASATASGS